MTEYELKIFRTNRRYEFDRLWETCFSMVYPLDSMMASERDKFKEFSWQIYLEGSLMTHTDIEEH